MEDRIPDVLKVLQFTANKAIELANANSVVGEVIRADDVIIIPISKLSVGFAGGGAEVTNTKKKRRNSPAGAGAKVNRTPMSFLVVRNGEAKMMAVDGSAVEGGGMVNKLVAQAKGLFAKKEDAKDEAVSVVEVSADKEG